MLLIIPSKRGQDIHQQVFADEGSEAATLITFGRKFFGRTGNNGTVMPLFKGVLKNERGIIHSKGIRYAGDIVSAALIS